MLTDDADAVVGMKGNFYNTNGEECGWFGLGTYAPSSSSPVQIHLGLGYVVSTMTVAWSTYETTGTPGGGTVEWSLAPDLGGKTTTAPGDVRPFTMDSGRTWYVLVRNARSSNPSVTSRCGSLLLSPFG